MTECRKFTQNFNRLEKWLEVIRVPSLTSPQRKNFRICSLHFSKEDFKVFSAYKKTLNEDAVPKLEPCNWPLNSQLQSSVGDCSSQFTSPLGTSFLSPISPHVNKEKLKRVYGSKSRKELFPSIQANEIFSGEFSPQNNDDTAVVSPVPSAYCGATDKVLCNSGRKRAHDQPMESDSNERKKAKHQPPPDNLQSSDCVTPQGFSCQPLLGSVSSPGCNIFNVTASSTPGSRQPKKRIRNEEARVTALKKKLAEKNKTINKLRMRLARSKKPKSSSLSAREIVSAAKPFLKPTMRILLDAQLKLSSCKKKGMRWSREMKDFTLGLMYHGPRCYRYLAKLIPLPSISTINRYQSLIHLKPGIHDHVKLGLMENVRTWSRKRKICSLIIDGMSISRHLEYDIKRDFVNGFTDDGLNRSNKPANQGIVAVLKGILSPWKQIIGHWLTTDSDPADVILKAVRDCVSFANEAGLILKLFVCDPGSKNRKLVRLLGVTEDKPYFMNGDEKVYFIWDPPHLIKNMRNNLLRRDFLWRGAVVSWKYIKALYFAQQKMRLKLTPKLTRRHVIFRSSFAKMKVKLATQVFSNSVNVALLTFIAFNRLPARAVHTASCCKDLNDLFDCFNSMQFVRDKLSLRYAIGQSSEHIPFLDPKMLGYFKNASFVGKKRQPFCLKDWILSIQGLLMFVKDLSNNYGVKSIRTRLLNQDTLENTFSTLRQQHGCSDNPTPKQLERGLRMVSLSSLMKLSSSSNCEEEMEKAAISLSKLPSEIFAPKKKAPPEEDLTLNEFSYDSDVDGDIDIIEETALYYCCGFITRQFARKHKCAVCEFKLLVDPDERMMTENYQMFMYFKAHSSKLDSDFGNLKAPSFESFETLKKIDNLFHQIFSNHSHERNIATKIKLAIDAAGLSLKLCSQESDDEFLSMLIRTRILWEVRFMNRRFEEERIEQQHQRKLKKLQGKDAIGGQKKNESCRNESEEGTEKPQGKEQGKKGKKIIRDELQGASKKRSRKESAGASNSVGTWQIKDVSKDIDASHQ